MAGKKTLTDITGPRYRKAGKAGKSVILDEFCATTGYNRKYAITLLRHAGKTQLRHVGNVRITAHRRQKRVYQRFYDDTVERAVLDIWEFFHRIYGTRLVPMIRANLSALAARFIIPAETQAKLAKVSRSTVERMLRRERKRHTAKGRAPRSPELSSNSRFLSGPSGNGTIKSPDFVKLTPFPTTAASLTASIPSP
jgi:hypothetical protein